MYHCDKNVQSLDIYATGMEHYAALQSYGEAQILEIFKSIMSGRMNFIVHNTMDLRQGREAVKQIMTNKLDKHMSGHFILTWFMSVQDSSFQRKKKSLI